jgi:hypothetical protein
MDVLAGCRWIGRRTKEVTEPTDDHIIPELGFVFDPLEKRHDAQFFLEELVTLHGGLRDDVEAYLVIHPGCQEIIGF